MPGSPTVVTGAIATAGDVDITQTRRVIQMADDIWSYDIEKNPFTLMTQRLNRKPVKGPEFKIQEDEIIPHKTRINNAGGYTSGATDLVVDNVNFAGDNYAAIIQRTGEVLRITARTTGSSTWVCTRGWGDSTAAAIEDNDQITILGAVAAEDSTAEASRSTDSAVVTNYIQFFRNPLIVTEFLEAQELYGPKHRMWMQKQKGVEHARDIELAFLFGSKKELASGVNSAVRTTGGMNEFISTNSQDFASAFALPDLFDFSEDLFRYGDSSTRVGFASRSVISNIALEAVKYVQTDRSEQTAGVKITRLETPHGDIVLVPHKLLDGDTYGGYMFVIDMDNVGYRFLRGFDTKLHTNIEAPDRTVHMDEYRTACGLFRALEATHGLITNAA